MPTNESLRQRLLGNRQSAVKRLPTVPGAKGDSPEPSPLAINVASPSICARAASGASVCEMVISRLLRRHGTAYPAAGDHTTNFRAASGHD